ncbi:uncharacterized protein LOC116165345 [Photinus pyralis]|nr:uncharacterized protein LOC116165345 [Photinus pyralis]
MSSFQIFFVFGILLVSGAQRLKFVEEFDVMPKILRPELAPGLDTSAMINVIDEIKNVLERYWFRSVVILIEDNLAVLKQAETYLRKIIASSNSLPVLSLMKFNSSGISTILANVSSSHDVFNRFQTNTNLYPVQVLEPEGRNALFYSILKVVRLFSGSSAVLVFTSRGTQDEDLAQLTWKELLENQIKVILWLL